MSEVHAPSSFDLHEGHNPASLGDEIQVPMPVPEAPFQNPPPSLRKPLRCDPLPFLAQHL